MSEFIQLPEYDDDAINKAQEYHKRKKKGMIIKIIFFSIAGLIILINLLGEFDSCSSNSSSSSHGNINATCYYYSQRLVKEKLKSPKSAEFPSYSSDFVTRDGDTVTVSAYVDADNSLGVKIRTNYVATIQLKNNKPASGSVVLIE